MPVTDFFGALSTVHPTLAPYPLSAAITPTTDDTATSNIASAPSASASTGNGHHQRRGHRGAYMSSSEQLSTRDTLLWSWLSTHMLGASPIARVLQPLRGMVGDYTTPYVVLAIIIVSVIAWMIALDCVLYQQVQYNYKRAHKPKSQ